MFDADLKLGDVLTWAEVSRLHRVRNGSYHRGGRVVSLLTDFGRINPCYPDFHGESPDVIHYTGSGRRGDQKLDPANRALHQEIKTRHSVPLFNKLAPNQWQYLGRFQITDSTYVRDEQRQRMVWRFTLRRAD